MSEKIKTINKEEIGEMEIPNNGNVWNANWTDDIGGLDSPKGRKKSLGFEFYEDEDGYVSREGISGETANMIVDFEESRKLFGNKAKRLMKMAKNESLGKEA